MSQNPVINRSGTAEITSDQYCAWSTTNGSTSSILITNESRANNCEIGITGAPSGMQISDNGRLKPMNGYFVIPPNSPDYSLEARGDFEGSTVEIMNASDPENDASARITTEVE